MASELPVGVSRPVRRRRLGLMAAAALTTFAAFMAAGIARRGADERNLRQWTDEQAVPTVRVLLPNPGAGSEPLDLPARMDAYSSAPIYARVSGYLKSWTRDIGADVKAGDLLGVIDTPDLDQQLLQAEANVAGANANANLAATTAQRSRILAATRAVSQQTADQDDTNRATQSAQLAAAKANLQLLEVQKSYARIVAPFDGRVTARNIDVGALITAGSGNLTALFQISDTSKLRIYVRVPQTYSPLIHLGDEALLRVPEYPGENFGARVVANARAIDPNSDTTLIQLLVDNRDGRLLPGSYAHLRFNLPVSPTGLRVPAEALIFNNNGPRVAALDANDRILFKRVTILRDDGNTVVLSSGLTPADHIIIGPPDGLSEGDRVHVVRDSETGKVAEERSHKRFRFRPWGGGVGKRLRVGQDLISTPKIFLKEQVMTDVPYRTALIVGAGAGISGSLARRLGALGVKVGLAARNIEKLTPICEGIGATAFQADASQADSVAALFETVDRRLGAPDIVVFNASARLRGPLADLDPAAVENAIRTTAFGGFLVTQQAARRMIPHGCGTILLTGASASVKGFSHSAAFAMGKFALRGLAQSAARELGPKGIHVVHFIIDGAVRSVPDPIDKPDSTLDPDAIAQTYIDILFQPRSAWSQEVDLRPWGESF